MWSFFGLLFFGGIFVLAHIRGFIIDFVMGLESVEEQNIANRIVIKPNDESNLIREVFCNKESYVKALSKIDDDMKFLLGNNWRDMYDKTLFRAGVKNFNYREGIVYAVYLASKGYITDSGRKLGYRLSDLGCKRKIRALMIIEKYMKQYYPELNPEIIIVPGYWVSPEQMHTVGLNSCQAFWNFFQGKDIIYSREYRGVVKKLSDLKPEQWNDIDKLQ